MSENENSNDVAEGVARHNANRHLALYLETRDGLLIWRAYQEFRKAGLAVPNEILNKIDQFADALSCASGNKGIADAMEMSKSGGGSAGWKRTAAKEKQRDVAEYIHILRTHTKRRPIDINKAAAKEFDTTIKNVKKIYSEWTVKAKKKKDTSLINNFMTKPW